MYSTADFRKGLKIEIDGTPYVIVDFLHVKPGKGGAFVRTKIKNLLTGRVLDQTFRSGERVKRPDLMERDMQYLYREDDNFYMMDNGAAHFCGVDGGGNRAGGEGRHRHRGQQTGAAGDRGGYPGSPVHQ